MEEQTATLASPTKRCSRCKQELAVQEFGVHRGQSDGLQPYCRPCVREYSKRRSRDVSKRKRKSLQTKASKYGIPVSMVKSLLRVPCCQACGAEFTEGNGERIDHCHDNNHVRGVLCHKCNLACAGPQRECIDRLRGCVSYLERDLERLAMEPSCHSTNRSVSNSRTGLSCIAAALSVGGPSPTAAVPFRSTTSSRGSTGTRPITPSVISVCAIAAMTCCMTAALLAIFRT